MIDATHLSKRYGQTMAVDDLSFSVPPGQVTGFLGPNGAGKSTTLRLILGLDRPTAGTVTVDGRPYTAYRRPLLEVGALLDAQATHPGRNAYDHLRCLALSNGISRGRVDQLLALVGLSHAARRRVGGFSLGMRQRLGIAAALLGDPRALLFDEPFNGLDPEGVHWFRTLVKTLAAEGRAVLLSSHLMSEMALSADRLIIIGRGRLLAQTTMAAFLQESAGALVRVRTPESDRLAALLAARGVPVAREPDGALLVSGTTTDAIGALATTAGLTVQELALQPASLEERYLALTREAVDYRAGAVDTGSMPSS